MLIVAGFQVPVITGLLVELEGNTGGVEFRHSGPIWVKVVVICGLIVIFIFTLEAHWPAFGVKV